MKLWLCSSLGLIFIVQKFNNRNSNLFRSITGEMYNYNKPTFFSYWTVIFLLNYEHALVLYTVLKSQKLIWPSSTKHGWAQKVYSMLVYSPSDPTLMMCLLHIIVSSHIPRIHAGTIFMSVYSTPSYCGIPAVPNKQWTIRQRESRGEQNNKMVQGPRVKI